MAAVLVARRPALAVGVCLFGFLTAEEEADFDAKVHANNNQREAPAESQARCDSQDRRDDYVKDQPAGEDAHNSGYA